MIEDMGREASAPESVNGSQAADAAATPETNGSGRGSDGRFALGNIGGPGNPFGRRLARNRKVIVEAISEEQLAALVQKVYAAAMEGSVQAQKMLLNYLAGKPAPVANPDRQNHEEWEMRKESPTAAEMEDQEHNRLPPAIAIGLHRCVDMVKFHNVRGQMEKKFAKAEERERRREERRAARKRKR